MLTVVIPTLNAAHGLPRTLAALGRPDAGLEIVVADGGSRDGTCALAEAHGARVVKVPAGRGPQLAAGAEAAAADATWLLFLHADTVPAPGWRDVVARHVATTPGRAGYFRFALDDPSSAARRVERLVAWRCRLLALPYGDQGLLISRELYSAVGGFAAVPLMEDVDLIRRLGRRRLAGLPATATTSAARYRRGGWWARPLRNLGILTLWFCGVPPSTLARLYR